MRYVRKITDAAEINRQFPDQSRICEEVCLKIARTGYGLQYVPVRNAFWHTFSPVASAYILSRLSDAHSLILGAWEDDVLVGLAVFQVREDAWGELLDIRVDTSRRRQGIAGLLLDTCGSFAIANHARGVCVTTTDTNPVMCHFLEHSGFEVGGIDRILYASTQEELSKPLPLRTNALTFYYLFEKTLTKK